MKRALLFLALLGIVSCGGPQGPGSSFTVSVTPQDSTIPAGASRQFTLTVTPPAGATGQVMLQVDAAEFLTITPLDPVALAGVTTRVITVAVAADATLGPTTVTITVRKDGQTIGTATVRLTITAAGTDPDPEPGAELVLGGAHALYLTAGGELWAWGSNFYGQAASDPDIEPSITWPRLVPALQPVGLAAGGSHSLAVTANGDVLTWGDNGLGQLGLGGRGDADHEPDAVQDLEDVLFVVAGGDTNFAFMADGSVRSWGYNAYGQLAVADTSRDRTEPTLEDIGTVSQVSLGSYHGVALNEDGEVFAWGRAFEGQLGDGMNYQSGDYSSTPALVDIGGAATLVAAGGFHSLALREDGALFSWGWDKEGQLGHDGDGNSPEEVPLPEGAVVAGLAAGGEFSLVLLEDGEVLAFGRNNRSQLGQGTTAAIETVVTVDLPEAAVSIAAGDEFAGAILQNGDVYMWGRYDSGQLGNGSDEEPDSLLPAKVVFEVR